MNTFEILKLEEIKEKIGLREARTHDLLRVKQT